jgi:hypothetical protein
MLKKGGFVIILLVLLGSVIYGICSDFDDDDPVDFKMSDPDCAQELLSLKPSNPDALDYALDNPEQNMQYISHDDLKSLAQNGKLKPDHFKHISVTQMCQNGGSNCRPSILSSMHDKTQSLLEYAKNHDGWLQRYLGAQYGLFDYFGVIDFDEATGVLTLGATTIQTDSFSLNDEILVSPDGSISINEQYFMSGSTNVRKLPDGTILSDQTAELEVDNIIGNDLTDVELSDEIHIGYANSLSTLFGDLSQAEGITIGTGLFVQSA